MTTKTSDSTKLAWDADHLASPHTQEDKARRVQWMFDSIAPTYEFINRVASMGRDRAWRRAMVRLSEVHGEDDLLDVACGTGDVARTFADSKVRPERIVGLDFAREMLTRATDRPRSQSLFLQADAQHLPLINESVSIVTCAFGIRNFQKLSAGLEEMHRVLRPGGRAVILEFTLPENVILRQLYMFYFRRIMPTAATVISRDRSGAYRYLPQSVVSFQGREGIVTALKEAGFERVTTHPQTFGIVAIYVAFKSA
jgi:demethylmenaquinone methyltransferase/2-methoxy-6-polyprenyl-1,4-benzoquinol methylase